MNLGTEENLITYKSGKIDKKMRSHLVSERFLLSMIKVLSSNLQILRRSLNNMRKFLNSIDRKYYSRDINLEAMLIVCDTLIETRLASVEPAEISILEFKIDTMLTDQYEDVKNHLIMPTIQLSKTELPNDELDFINESLDYNLKYGKIIADKDNLVEAANEISTCAYTDFKEAFLKFRDRITEYYNFFNETDRTSGMDSIVHTADDSFLSYMKETLSSIKNPASSLQTGWQGMNSMLGPRGGFLNKNLYIYYASVNSFKSALLLHLARMLRMYNVEKLKAVSRTTGRIPTILYLEYENDRDEDNERLYKIVVKADLCACTSSEEMTAIWNKKFDKNDGTYTIDMSFLHKDSDSMSVDDIEKIIEHLKEEGFEVVAAIIDYIEKIKCNEADKHSDLRIKLKGIAESLLNLAKRQNIPIITAHQLNRGGGALLSNAKAQGMSNVAAGLSNEYIGESYAIEKAVSFSAFIDIEEHEGKKYLLVKRNKTRYQRFGVDFFVMEINDGIIIDDDIGMQHPLYFNCIPGTDVVSDMSGIKEGKRGAYDIREKKETVKANNKIAIGDDDESQESKSTKSGTSILDLIDYPDWSKYTGAFGMDALTTDGGCADMFEINYLEDDQYGSLQKPENKWVYRYNWSEEECSICD